MLRREPLSADYRDRDKLTAFCGVERMLWPVSVLNEVGMMNALDIADEAGVAPRIDVQWGANAIRLTCHGTHLPLETVRAVANYATRASSRAWLVDLARGPAGSALMTSLAMCSLDGGWTEIETRDYHIRVDVAPVQGGGVEGRVTPLGGGGVNGTRFSFHWPGTDKQGPVALDNAARDLLRRGYAQAQ